MGYTTYFDGEVTIEPPLNPAEIAYLEKFAQTRRMKREQGPYYVGDSDQGILDNNYPDGQPGLWCQWTPAEDGSAIQWDEGEKFYESDDWMLYLIDHFLKPGAVASTVDDPQFADFTFDHICNGIISADGEDSDDRWRIHVEDNAVYVDSATFTYDGDEAHPQPHSDTAAMDQIHAILSGSMWSADHLVAIADVITGTGREIAPPEDQ